MKKRTIISKRRILGASTHSSSERTEEKRILKKILISIILILPGIFLIALSLSLLLTGNLSPRAPIPGVGISGVGIFLIGFIIFVIGLAYCSFSEPKCIDGADYHSLN